MIPYGRHYIDQDDIDAVTDILRNGALTQGPAVEAFERAVAEYVGAKYAVAVSSATAGLHLAAIVAGVGPGSALITTPITFVASANAADINTGAGVGLQSVGYNQYSTHETMVFDTVNNGDSIVENIMKLGKKGEEKLYSRTAHSEGEMFGLSKSVLCCPWLSLIHI